MNMLHRTVMPALAGLCAAFYIGSAAAADPAKCAAAKKQLVRYYAQVKPYEQKIKAVEEKHGVFRIRKEWDQAKVKLHQENQAAMAQEQKAFVAATERDASKMQSASNDLQAIVEQHQENIKQMMEGRISAEEGARRNEKIMAAMDKALKNTEQQVQQTKQSQPAGRLPVSEQVEQKERALRQQYKPQLDAARKAADEENKPDQQAAAKLQEQYKVHFAAKDLHCPHEGMH